MGLPRVSSNVRGVFGRGTPYPHISVLGMDILSRLINKVVEGNFLSGCKIRDRGEEEELELSHFLYANDTLLFYKDCNTLKYTLVVFDMFRVFCRHNLNVS